MSRTAKAYILLVITAVIWGTTFLYQKLAMTHISPMAYGGLRFTLGGLALLPFAVMKGRNYFRSPEGRAVPFGQTRRLWLTGTLLAGLLIFAGATLQQYGLVQTTAGKGGFITSLYVVLVPIIGRVFWGEKTHTGLVIGIAMGFVGLYLLSANDDFTSLAPGDGLVFIGSVFWALHVIVVGKYSPVIDSLILASGQALVCGFISLAAAIYLGELSSFEAIEACLFAIAWGGLLSVALAYTLQVVAQKDADPTTAAIILQLESVAAALTGCLVLNEVMTGRMLIGAGLILVGIIVSQVWPIWQTRRLAGANITAGPVEAENEH